MLYSSIAETVLASSTLNPIPPFASISQKESVTEFHSRDLNWTSAEGKKERKNEEVEPRTLWTAGFDARHVIFSNQSCSCEPEAELELCTR